METFPFTVAQEVAIPHKRSRSSANENQLLDVSVVERYLPEMKGEDWFDLIYSRFCTVNNDKSKGLCCCTEK